MASSLSWLEEDLLCPVCLEIFKDPVILSCSHSFCRACIEEHWNNCLRRDCPVCRERSVIDKPLPDLTLKNTCESYVLKKEQRSNLQRGEETSSIQKQEMHSDSQIDVCSLHLEKLILFCVDDQQQVCAQCVSHEHQNHSFCSISKAASSHKERLQSLIQDLEMKHKMFQKVKTTSDNMAAHIKLQAVKTEKQMNEEFEKLHQFLREEQESRLCALREEEEEKSQRMKKKIEELNKQIKDISTRIKDLQTEDDASLLQNFKILTERAQYQGPEPEPLSGILIDVAKHLGNLGFRVLEKASNRCQSFPVILDPNTANPFLNISVDLSSISLSDVPFDVPDNPERMSACEGILGSVGFSSGTHSWQVDVGHSDDWIVGVAAESVCRKEKCLAAPENGFLSICRVKDEILSGRVDNSEEFITRAERVRRICVTLNCEIGQVVFNNSDDNTVLQIYRGMFTEKMYPYFYSNSKQWMRIQPCFIPPF